MVAASILSNNERALDEGINQITKEHVSNVVTRSCDQAAGDER
jgi:hypothetical protein